MYFLVTSLLLICTALHAHTSKTHHSSPKPRQYNTRKVNNLHDDYNNCFCYPGGQLPTVDTLLDSQNDGQERLVIYLYKIIGTNEIKIYIPGTEKQLLIPDIPYDAGDSIVKGTTESVVMLFQNNQQKTKIYNKHVQPVNPAVIDSLPIGLNVGEIENIFPSDVNNLTPDAIGYPGQNDYNVYIAQSGENENGANRPYNEVINNYPGSSISNQWLLPEDYTKTEATEQQWWSNKINYAYENPLVPPDGYNPNVDEQNELVYTFKTNDQTFKLIPDSQSVSDDLVSINPAGNRYVTFNIWFTQQMKRFQNTHLLHDITTIDSAVLRLLVKKTFSENNIYIGSDGLIRDSSGKIIDASNLQLRPMFIGETVNYQILKNLPNKITLPKHLPYLEGILVMLVDPSHVLGIIPLGKTYLYEAPDNHKLITQPASLNTSTVYIKEFANGYPATDSSTVKVPYTLSVKESYSGKSLVPVSDNSNLNVYKAPYSIYSYSSVNKKPQSGGGEVNNWSSGPYNAASIETIELQTVQPLPYKRRKLTDAKIKHHYDPPISKTKKKNLSKTNTKTGGRTDSKGDALNVNSLESGRRLSVPAMVKTLLHMLQDSPSRRDSQLGFNSTEEVGVTNGSENINDGERVDFRIIGGNAATGSGTPLSNKGRSGYQEYVK